MLWVMWITLELIKLLWMLPLISVAEIKLQNLLKQEVIKTDSELD